MRTNNGTAGLVILETSFPALLANERNFPVDGLPTGRMGDSVFGQPIGTSWTPFGREKLSMDLKLLSEDRELHKLCRETLSDIPGQSWRITVVSPENAGGDADLWLWDYRPQVPLPPDIARSASRFLFLVHRKDLPGFHERIEIGRA